MRSIGRTYYSDTSEDNSANKKKPPIVPLLGYAAVERKEGSVMNNRSLPTKESGCVGHA